MFKFKQFFKMILGVYALIFCYLIILRIAIALPVHPAFTGMLLSYIIEPIAYIAIGIIYYSTFKDLKTISIAPAIIFILMGIIVPILPVTIPYLFSGSIFFQKFAEVHISFLIIGGIYLATFIEKSLQSLRL